MDNFGKRLKEERERIGLSQAKLADACGIGKTTQYMYERGERDPTAPYMQLAAKVGVDVFYVLSGDRTLRDRTHADAYGALVIAIEGLLGLDEERLQELANARVTFEIQEGQAHGDDSVSSDGRSHAEWIQQVSEWLTTSRRPDRCIDAGLFARLQNALGDAAAAAGAALTGEKCVRAALLLYPETKASGSIDNERIAEVVRLVTS